MKQLYIFLLVVGMYALPVYAQNVGIGTGSPHASAQLDITHGSRGLLIPRLTTAEMMAIANPAKGLLVYDSVKNQLMVNMGSTTPDWQTIVFKSGWALGGNTGTDTAQHFVGTGDNVPLRFKVNNQHAGVIDANGFNTALGTKALLQNFSGTQNVAIGSSALQSNSGHINVAVGDSAGYFNSGSNNVLIGGRAGRNSGGSWNTIIGYEAGMSNTAWGVVFVGSGAGLKNTSGSGNTFIGDNAGTDNTNGSSNTFVGSFAGPNNIGASGNTGIGSGALFSNTTGTNNCAVGLNALTGNIGGIRNTALGVEALLANNSNYNTAMGSIALRNNGAGASNVASGYQSLYANTSGSFNTGVGVNTLYSNTTASNNTAAGNEALFYNTIGTNNAAHGHWALRANVSGSQNTAIGAFAGNNNGTNPANFTAIGYNAGHVGSGSNSMELGNTSVSWIGGMVGWSTYFSDARAKTGISANVPGISFINKLRPVTYYLNLQAQNELLGIRDTVEWEGKYDIERKLQSGFVAQEVEQVARELGYDFNGVAAPEGNRKLYSMQYAAFVVPLVKAVQEQQQMIEDLKKQIDALNKKFDALMKE